LMPPKSGATAVFRVDAGWRLGSGHVMRCLTIADALRAALIECSFVCRAHPGHMADIIEKSGFPVSLVPADDDSDRETGYAAWRGGTIDSEVRLMREAVVHRGGADLLIVDHYGLDASYESRLRNDVRSIVVIDDLHDRAHDCDILIDQNIGHDPSLFTPYVSKETLLLVGAQYAPIRPDFAALRQASLNRRRSIDYPRTLLVSVGGSDHQNVTYRVLEALKSKHELGIQWIEKVHIVLTSMAPHLEAVRSAVALLPNVELHIDSQKMPQLMLESDLAIGGSGVTAIERCVMALPTLTVVLAENQVGSARRLDDAGAAHTLGHGDAVSAPQIADQLRALRNDRRSYRSMIEASASLCDGLGLPRIIPHIVALTRSHQTA
jgi:UDP-2,4-diacetamido-2,4,6-trideoxy-beta-L-altropyranose hydrolase